MKGNLKMFDDMGVDILRIKLIVKPAILQAMAKRDRSLAELVIILEESCVAYEATGKEQIVAGIFLVSLLRILNGESDKSNETIFDKYKDSLPFTANDVKNSIRSEFNGWE